ncbi:hypothetical protein COU01_00055 [Candidatus Falkowbacteria bacterium CG10_big_fil_rev_8_21_14_0_10_44_15]|uniref:Phosphoenolpyruvate synthase n=1 Tax=Candidatus Falkowbacteria bacterium CG10_big_fil_rev_8_21_14_0_10_44_15 TaxID=1974569 RepID=A0A2H0V0Z2_9BACT|nr:MAG: hypothetical protein COU01_00055 [Candidatus Falkowbacteria bacterium CG10_big_fil_rev_8_21_14_0_10_44_15]
MSKFIKHFKDLSYKDVATAGGKGASLGEMSKAGIPVPPGFVILASAFEYFLDGKRQKAASEIKQEIEAQLQRVNYQDTNSIDRASNVIRDIMQDTPMPKELAAEIVVEFKKLRAPLVAVRSSATAEDSLVASWAGELETYLNTTAKNLLDNVKRCWSSLFTPRAIFYRYEKKLSDQAVQVAVVVQAMVQSEISGIAFSAHPVTRAKNQMVIEAGWGLGEAIVSGQVTPDTYVIDKRDFSIIDINVSEQKRMLVKKINGGIIWKAVPKDKQNKQALSGKQIIELARMVDKIEKRYHRPQDIEWAYAGGKFYITQSRPITTL